MNLRLQNQCASRAAARGTTLPELLVAMAVLLIMVLVMASLVSDIQKVFRNGRAQADAIENGRAAMDMIVRDIEQMAAANAAFNNFIASPGMIRAVGTNDLGPNILYHSNEFFCTTYDTSWHAVAYGFYDPAGAFSNMANNVTGKLYRWQTNAVTPIKFWNDYNNDLRAANTNLLKVYFPPVVNGVVHFRVQPISLGVLAAPSVPFISNSLPTHVEIELGIVETRFAGAITNLPMANQIPSLAANLGKVYFFRQLVPIKNAYK